MELGRGLRCASSGDWFSILSGVSSFWSCYVRTYFCPASLFCIVHVAEQGSGIDATRSCRRHGWFCFLPPESRVGAVVSRLFAEMAWLVRPDRKLSCIFLEMYVYTWSVLSVLVLRNPRSPLTCRCLRMPSCCVVGRSVVRERRRRKLHSRCQPMRYFPRALWTTSWW